MKTRKIISVALALLMVLTVVPFSALTAFAATGEVVLSADGKTLITYPSDKADYEYSIPDGVETIAAKAFNRNESLGVLNIPASVKVIEDAAIYGCNYLETITVDPANTAYKTVMDDTGYEGLYTIDGKKLVAYPAYNAMDEYPVMDGVTEIGSGVFAFADLLTGIALPDSVVKVGSDVLTGSGVDVSTGYYVTKPNGEIVLFAADPSVTDYAIPVGTTIIAGGAFDSSIATNITVPASVTTMNVDELKAIATLKTITVDSANTVYAATNGILFDKDMTTILCIPASIETTTFTFPRTMKVIPANVLKGNKKVTTVIIEGAETIEEGAFSDSAVATIDLGKKLKTIGSKAFAKSAIAELNIPASVTTIADDAFADMTSLKKIVVDPANMNFATDDYSILYNKDMTKVIYFMDITGVEKFVTSTNMKEIPANFLKGDKGVKSFVINGAEIIGVSAFEDSAITSVDFGANVKEIRSRAFAGTTFTEINIPASVKTIAADAFENMKALEKIVVDPANTEYASVDGILYDKTMTKILFIPEKATSSVFTFPEGMKEIPAGIFKGNTTIKEVVINGATSIGASAFEGSAVEKVTLSKSVETIGENAFKDCTKLKSVEVKTGLKTIGKRAFYGCTNLRTFYIPNTVTSVGEFAFYKGSAALELRGTTSSVAAKVAEENLVKFVAIPDPFTWVSKDGVWKYYDENSNPVVGWQTINGKEYYFYADGKMAADAWVNGYYLAASGEKIVEGWRDGGWYMNADGTYAANEFKLIEGKWYYFKADGYYARGEERIGSYIYFFDNDGVMVSNKWVGNKYYDNNGHYVANKWNLDDYGWWYSLGDGTIAINQFRYIDGYWYYFNEYGYILTNTWKWINGECYYFYGNGTMARDTFLGNNYVDASGKWVPNKWIKDAYGTWYQYGNGKNPAKEFKAIDGVWYYFNEYGYRVTGWKWIDNYCYYFYADGSMAVNTYIEGEYVDASGAWCPGKWVKNFIGWRYMNGDGSYVANQFKYINGAWYYFNTAGYMVTGWRNVDGSWFYFTESGAMVSNTWSYIDGHCYYFYANGVMAKNTTIDGCYVDASGAWVVA